MKPELKEVLDAIGGLEGLKKLTEEQYAQLEAAITEEIRKSDPNILKVVYGEVPASSPSPR